MTNGYTIPSGYGGFTQGYMGGQQYAQGMQTPPPQTQQPQMPPVSQPRQTQQQMAYNCIPVTSREEAMAIRAELLSMGTIMPDLAHGCIYLKRLNPNTGTSEFFDFLYSPPQQPQQDMIKQQNPSDEYVIREDFDKLCDAVIKIQKEMQSIKGETANE